MRSSSDCSRRECRRNLPPELSLSRFRLRKNSPKVMATARNTRAPITVPATAAIDVPFAGTAVEVGEGVDELELELDVLELLAEVRVDVEDVEVDVALVAVDTGESTLRHVISSVIPTVLTSEHPPLRPCASNIMNTREVPWATFAFHEKLVGPTGGFKMMEVPPGTVAW